MAFTKKPPQPPEPTREQVLMLALKAQADPATARKALIHGVESIRGTALKERLNQAISREKLGP